MTIPASGAVSVLNVIDEMKGASSPYGDLGVNSFAEINQYLMGVSSSTSRSLSSLRSRTITHKTLAEQISDSGAVWANDANVDDGTGAYTSVQALGAQGVWLCARKWGYNIPTFTTIYGIVVTMEAMVNYNGDSGGDTRLQVALTKNGSSAAADTVALTLPTSFGALGTGGNDGKYYSSLWGTTWTASEVNNDNFGLLLRLNKVAGSGTIWHTVTVRNLRFRVHHA